MAATWDKTESGTSIESETFRPWIEAVNADHICPWQNSSNESPPDLNFICLRKAVFEIGKYQLTACVG